MNTLEKNMMTIFGKKGEDWLAQLPHIVNELADYWGLQQVVPVPNMSFNYVAKAYRSDQPVVVKINCENIDEEAQALHYFAGNGSIQLLDHHAELNALLLQQAIPGVTLTSLYAENKVHAMDCYIATMQKLHAKSLPKKQCFKPINEWLSAIDHLSDHSIPPHLVKTALILKNKLLSSMTAQVFLHGDLHHDNILQNDTEWIAIDPKGVVGEPEFEIAAFDFMYVQELAQNKEVKRIFESRVKLLADKANLSAERIRDWVFVRLILMAAWQIEDQENPKWALRLAEEIF